MTFSWKQGENGRIYQRQEIRLCRDLRLYLIIFFLESSFPSKAIGIDQKSLQIYMKVKLVG